MNAMATTAQQTSVHHVDQLLFFTLLQLIIILLAARAACLLRRKFGQPQVVAEIIAGLVLGPSLLGSIAPEIFQFVFYSVSSEPIAILSQIGLILLMFQIGMDFDFSHLQNPQNRKASTMISGMCIALPFALGFMLGQVSAPILAPHVVPLSYSLFMATALSITAMPVLGRIMMEFDLTQTPVGVISISAAAINDVVGWFLLAVISALSISQYSSSDLFSRIGWLLLYVSVCWLGVRPFLHRMIRHFEVGRRKLPQNLLAIILILIFISGMCTYQIGIFAIFGGFMLGVLVHDEHTFVSSWKKNIGKFVIVFFLPIFFTHTGLRTNINTLDTISLWHWCVIIVFTATAGKFGGAYLAARATGLDGNQASTIGILMNTRGLMELVVLNVGYDLGIIPQNVFTILVIMAAFSTIVTAPVLRTLLPKMGHVVPSGIDA